MQEHPVHRGVCFSTKRVARRPRLRLEELDRWEVAVEEPDIFKFVPPPSDRKTCRDPTGWATSVYR